MITEQRNLEGYSNSQRTCRNILLSCTSVLYIDLISLCGNENGQAGKSPTTSLGFNIHRDIRTERSWWKCVRDRFAPVTMALYYREMDRVQDDCSHGSWGKYFVGVVNHFAPAIFTVFQLWWGMRYGIVRSHWFGLVSDGTGPFRHGLQEDTIRQVGSQWCRRRHLIDKERTLILKECSSDIRAERDSQTKRQNHYMTYVLNALNVKWGVVPTDVHGCGGFSLSSYGDTGVQVVRYHFVRRSDCSLVLINRESIVWFRKSDSPLSLWTRSQKSTSAERGDKGTKPPGEQVGRSKSSFGVRGKPTGRSK